MAPYLETPMKVPEDLVLEVQADLDVQTDLVLEMSTDLVLEVQADLVLEVHLAASALQAGHHDGLQPMNEHPG